ncbi:MAG: aminotransferase class IV [Rhodospirillales bacterium]|nr:aminotransferase class IV [Rhodospirillales bacterium]
MKDWLNGAFIDKSKAAIRADDRGFTLGDGLFETMAVRDGAVMRVDAHLARLRTGCEVLAMPLSMPNEELKAAMTVVIAENAVNHGTLRLTISRGPAPRGVLPPEMPKPTILITAAEVPLAPPRPAAVAVSRTVRRNAASPLVRVKSLNYLENTLAALEAARLGADDALIPNLDSKLAEATASNLFAVIDGKAMTPPIGDGALPGTMRAAVIDALDAAEESLGAARLEAASEIFLSNSAGIRPVVKLEGQPVGNARPGPVWASLGGLILGRERP